MSKKRFYLLSIRDIRKPFYVFSTSEPGGAFPQFRPEYEHLRCKECGRFDAMEAAKQVGVPNSLVPSMKRDAMVSMDFQYVVSTRSKEVIESVPGAEAHFFPFPAAPDFFLMYPKQTLEAPPHTKASEERRAPPEEENPFAFCGKRCKLCGIRGIRFWSNYCEVPGDMVFGAAKSIMDSGASTSDWIASKDVADALKKAQLSGWWIRADQLLN